MHNTKQLENGQGLVEYALILILVSVVSVGILTLTGSGLQDAYCTVITELNPDEESCAEPSNIQITQSKYNKGKGEITIKATYMGGYDASVTLTADPGGAMTEQGGQYVVKIGGATACPCVVTITSSEGDKETVTVN